MLEQVQKRNTKIIRGLEHLCSEDSLRLGGWRREAFRENNCSLSYPMGPSRKRGTFLPAHLVIKQGSKGSKLKEGKLD